ncbi:MAG: tyrosine-type recombinase/integrase [Lachnospiraceae bacterium]|nr:tyrosine-type recombinase/integrase [Lachnospiraceae bacterium]
MIRSHGYIYRGHPNSISKYLESIEEKLGIPHFTIHKLHHYFASRMGTLNVPDADIMRMGGWETDHVMKSIYRHSMMARNEKAKREAADKLGEVLFS